MTKTKSQKQRAKAMRAVGVNAVKVGNGSRALRKAVARENAEWSFLNGNTFKLSLARKQALGRQGVQRIQAPTAFGMKGKSSKARMATSTDGVTHIRHSEYIRDILPSVEFSIDPELINPGNINLFPWLASIAIRYTTYEFKNLRFRYEPATSTTLPGTVILTCDYNPDSAPPASKVEALAMEDATRTVPWECVTHESSPANLHKRSSYYVRNGDQTSAIESELYDVGLFSVMVQGVPTDLSPSIGELYVDYDIELRTPVLTPMNANPIGSGQVSGKAPFDSGAGGTVISRFIWDRDTSYEPESIEGLLVQAGPGINVDSTAGPLIGALEFKTKGAYCLSFEFTKNGLLIPAWDGTDFSFGADGLTGVEKIYPTGLDPVMIDVTGDKASATYLINFSNVDAQDSAKFGLAPILDYTGVSDFDITGSVTITPVSPSLLSSFVSSLSVTEKRIAAIKRRNKFKRLRLLGTMVPSPKTGFIPRTLDIKKVDQTAKLNKINQLVAELEALRCPSSGDDSGVDHDHVGH